jgi:hypothetical protein
MVPAPRRFETGDWRERVKVRFRALVIALVALVVLDLVLRLSGVSLPVPRVYRLPSRTVIGYDQLIKSMADEKSPRVAVVGDSIVWGSPLMPGETLSTYLTDALRANGVSGARAYNLGFVGGHSNDLMPVVAEVAQKKAADVILLNLDYRFYNSKSRVQSRYPQIYDRVDWSKLPVPASLREPPGTQPKPDAQGIADGLVSRVWKLYSIRDYLTVSLFKDTPAEAASREFTLWRIRGAGRPVWLKRKASGLPLDELRGQFALGTLNENDVYVRYLGAALDAARAEGVPVVVWAGPVDRAMLDKEGVWDRAEYRRNLAFIGRYVEERGGTFVDYTSALDSKDIVDSHHPMGEGYRKLATKVAPLLRSILTSGAATSSTTPSATPDGGDGK